MIMVDEVVAATPADCMGRRSILGRTSYVIISMGSLTGDGTLQMGGDGIDAAAVVIIVALPGNML